MALKRLDLFTDYELRQELGITSDQPTRDYIVKLLRQRSEQRVKGNKEIFKDHAGQVIPGYLTTSELIAELDAEPAGTDRYTSLAVEATHRAASGAFPAHRVPTLVVFGFRNVFISEIGDDGIVDVGDTGV